MMTDRENAERHEQIAEYFRLCSIYNELEKAAAKEKKLWLNAPVVLKIAEIETAKKVIAEAIEMRKNNPVKPKNETEGKQ